MLLAAVVLLAIVLTIVLPVLISEGRKRRRLRERAERVRLAAAEAAGDDPYFAADAVEEGAREVFLAVQAAWSAHDRTRLATLLRPELLAERERRLDDVERRGWRNHVRVEGTPVAAYVGLVNRADAGEDRVVVRIKARLTTFTVDRAGIKIPRPEVGSERGSLVEYWTLARRGDGWIVATIESKTEGEHHLDGELIATPWSDRRVVDEALVEVAAGDAVPEGFTTVDLATLGFDGDAREHALDLSLADARFAPDLLEAAARRAAEAWAEAIDGDDAPLERLATPTAIADLLYAGDTSRRTRIVVRGLRVSQIAIEEVDVTRTPARMTVTAEVFGRRYVEVRDTGAVLTGSKDNPRRFGERWTLALEGPDEAPWRLVEAPTDRLARRA